ncbi:MAG: hypothetical protein JKY65_18855 [Planctomycetes bacterium]|nr:hypothetical protein [Planctomycetota bacterium]
MGSTSVQSDDGHRPTPELPLAPSARQPLILRLWAWLWSRFGPKMWLLYLVLYAASLLFGRSLVVTGEIRLGLKDVAGGMAAMALFLLIRVVDEHKDFEQDCKSSPDSVLARGEVTLGHLRVVGGVALALQVGVLLWLEGGFGVTTLAWAGVVLWVFALALLTGKWLEERFLLLTIVHVSSFSLAIVWLIQMGARPEVFPAGATWLVALSLLSAAAFEVTRKTHGPEEEPAEAPSFSKLWGPRSAALASGLLLLAGAGALIVVLRGLGCLSWWWPVLVALTYIVALVSLGRFAAAPSRPGYKRNQLGVALALLGSHSLVVVGVAVERGLTWS